LVSSLAKLREEDAAVVDGDKVLYMATAQGAMAMGLCDCDRIGVGKKADLVMIDLQQPNMQPMNNVSKNLVYSGSKQNVKMTMINGEILYEDGVFSVGLDPKEIYARVSGVVERLR
jgi:5-methylthioadenosine/S-adenosylhomocysteine deaminase